MKIVMPSVEIIPRMDPIKKIELCARVAYKSEDKITEDSAERFVKRLIERGHTSVLEHARVLAPETALSYCPPDAERPYGWRDRVKWFSSKEYGAQYHVTWWRTLNARDFIALGGTLEQLKTLEEADDYMSVRFTCDRAIANELVRHRQLSFTQSSTRYINYREGVEFVLPVPFGWTAYSEVVTDLRPASEDPLYAEWKQACSYAERAYIQMIRHGATPQEARDVLPLSTKTELIMTGMYKQWEDVFKLRLDKAAHPQMRYLMKLLVNLPEFPKDKIHVEDKTDD